MKALRATLTVALAWLLLASSAYAQVATVKRNANLRVDPSTD